MPISLDTFQHTLDTSKIQGFVKLSEGGDAVKSYGGGFFARHFGLYTKPTAEENNAMRRAFYESMVNSLHCRGQVLADLRSELGIGEDGTSTSGEQLSVADAKKILQRVKAGMAEQSANAKERQDVLDSLDKGGFLDGAIRRIVTRDLGIGNPDVADTKLNNTTAREIRNFAMDATTNRTVRNNLLKQLEDEGLCQGEIGAYVRSMLHIDDEEEVIKPLSQSDRDAVITLARDASAHLHAERLAAQKLPTAETFDHRLVPPDKLESCKAILANPCASQEEINSVTREINTLAMQNAHEGWASQVGDALAEFSRETGIDCTSLKDSILSKIERGLNARCNSSIGLAVVAAKDLQEMFSKTLASVVSDRKAMADSLAATAKDLPPVAVTYLRNELATNLDFRKPAQMETLIRHFDASRPLLNLFHAENVTEANYLDAYVAMSKNIQTILKTYREAGGDDCDTPVTAGLGRMLFDMGKAVMEAETGKPLPVRDDIKAMAEKHIRQVNFVIDELSDNPSSDFRASDIMPSILDLEAQQVHTFLNYCGNTPDRAAQTRAVSEEEKTLSPALEKHLEDLGISRVHHDIANGNSFNITLRSAFKEALTTCFANILKLADDDAKFPTVGKAFTQPFKDYSRVGTGLKIEDTVIAYNNDSYNEGPEKNEATDKMATKVESFFMKDPTNGMRAARIIGGIAQQGFAADVLRSIMRSREPFEGSLFMDTSHAMQFSLNRAGDGSYKVHYTGIFCYCTMSTNDGMVSLDPSRSRLQFDIDIKLSFDPKTNEPTLSLDGNPTMSGRLTQLGIDMVMEGSKLINLHNPEDDTEFKDISLNCGVLNDPAVKHAVFEDPNQTDAIDLIKDRVLLRQDNELLRMLGLGAIDIENMVLGLAGDESVPRLGKEIIGRLKDPSTRDAAIHDISVMMEPTVRAGFVGGVPAFHPEILNLVTVAGLSPVTLTDGMSDALLVANFIAKSNDPSVQRLPADLQSSDQSVVAAAKERVQQIAREVRRGLGLSYLANQIIPFEDATVRRLQKHIPAAQLDNLMQHVIDRDEAFHDSIDAFKSLIESVKIIEAGSDTTSLQG